MNVLLCLCLLASALAVAPVRAATEKPRRAPTTNLEKDTGYRLGIADIRHNVRCRYYKLRDNHPCGPKDGTPCKICGG